MLIQVDAVGSLCWALRSNTPPTIWMQRGGSRYLKPSSGGRLQEVTNFRNWPCCSPVKLSNACEPQTPLYCKLGAVQEICLCLRPKEIWDATITKPI